MKCIVWKKLELMQVNSVFYFEEDEYLNLAPPGIRILFGAGTWWLKGLRVLFSPLVFCSFGFAFMIVPYWGKKKKEKTCRDARARSQYLRWVGLILSNDCCHVIKGLKIFKCPCNYITFWTLGPLNRYLGHQISPIQLKCLNRHAIWTLLIFCTG